MPAIPPKRRVLTALVAVSAVTLVVLSAAGWAFAGVGLAAAQAGANGSNATNGTSSGGGGNTAPSSVADLRGAAPGAQNASVNASVNAQVGENGSNGSNGSGGGGGLAGGAQDAVGGVTSTVGGIADFSMGEDVIRPSMNETRKMLANSTVWVLNQSLEVTVGTPVPQDNNDDGIVFVPTNDPWAGLYHQYFIPFIFPLAAVLSLLGMILECGIMPWRALRNPTYSQSRAFVGFILSLTLLVFTMPIITVMHAFVDILATNVAPSSAEMTQSTKGLMNLSAGAILGVVAAYGLGLTQALILAFIYALRYGALFVLPWFLPLLGALAYNAPHERLSQFASHMIWQYVGLLIQAVPVALLFRAALVMEWDFGFGGLIGVLASVAIFLFAASFPLVTSIGMFKAAPSVQTVAAGAAGAMAGSSAADYARQAPGEAARGGYKGMVSMKTSIMDRVRAIGETPDGGIPEDGQL